MAIKFSPKILLKKLSKLEEYYYPTTTCSLFLLPDGKLVGADNLFQHRKILEQLMNRKIPNDQDAIDILIKTCVSRIIINDYNVLHVNLLVYPTQEQKFTLEGLGMCGKYSEIVVDINDKLAPNAPSWRMVSRLFEMPISPSDWDWIDPVAQSPPPI